MRITPYKTRTYAQLDTWSCQTKQTQTKPILPDLPLTARQKTALISFSTRPYATTPQTQKQTQTNPISPPGPKQLLDDLKHKHKKYRACTTQAADMFTPYISTNQGQLRYKGFRTTCYDTASDAAALAPGLCRLNNNSDKACLQNHRFHEKSTCNRDANPIVTRPVNFLGPEPVTPYNHPLFRKPLRIHNRVHALEDPNK
jgi:hypothetical protein